MSITPLLENFVTAISLDAKFSDKALFLPPHCQSIDSRLEVYKDGYIASLNRALAQIYPVLQTIVGEPCFNRMALDFIQLYPSVSVDLNNYGKEFSFFIEQKISPLQVFSGLPYLSDLAKLELAWHEAYFAADGQIFPFDSFELQLEQTDSVTLQLNPSLSFFVSPYPVIELWQSHRQGNKPEHIQQCESEYYIAITRIDDHISVTNISSDAFQLLHNCKHQRSLVDIAELEPGSIQQLAFVIEQRFITGFSNSAHD